MTRELQLSSAADLAWKRGRRWSPSVRVITSRQAESVAQACGLRPSELLDARPGQVEGTRYISRSDLTPGALIITDTAI